MLREAVACTSPSLALRADRIAAGLGVPARQVRSAAVALARYQLRAAGRPTPFGTRVRPPSGLACWLSSAFPGSGDKGVRMLAELVRLGFLTTSLRPPMTTTDALGHVTRELRAAGVHEIPEMAGLLEQLETLHRDLAAHNAAEPEHQGAMRESLSTVVTEISAEGHTPLCLDLRLDAEVMLPEPVGQEMAATASARCRLRRGDEDAACLRRPGRRRRAGGTALPGHRGASARVRPVR